MSMNKSKAAPQISSVMRRLSAYIAQARNKALPAAVLEATKHHVLDSLAAMASGSQLRAGEVAHAYVKPLGGAREATVVGSKFVTNAVNAALANGMQAHADETDDSHSHSVTHPGCSIVSAALAMAERSRSSGTALLRAVALGYDVATRMNMMLGGMEFAKLGHLTSGFGPAFGTTAACAALSHFNEQQVRHALSYAAQQASGVSCFARDPEHIEKAFGFGGMPARNGVSAALLVAAGATAVADVFTGERSFMIAYDESRRTGRPLDPQTLVRELGKTYEIKNTTIKRWSVGSPIQAPLDSLLELMRNEHVKAQDVAKLVVRVYAGGARITDSREMSDINMQHMCALMLNDGYVTFDAAHDMRRMKDPRLLALRKKIELVADEELEKLRPSKQAIVELTLTDGRRLRHHTRAVRGTPHNPMTRAEVDEKCHHLMASVLGAKRARALCDAVWDIERVKDARSLRPLLQA